MKSLISLFVIALTATAGAAYGADNKPVSEKQAAQHNRMKACSAEAKEKALKKDERRAFMSSCLKGSKQ